MRQILDLHVSKSLLSGTGLFEIGLPEDAASPEGFILRVNRQVFLRMLRPTHRARFELATAISPDGGLRSHAELIVFGTWLLCNGMPGSRARPGKAPDLHKLFKVAAAAFAALASPSRSLKGDISLKRQIQTKDIVKFWNVCFDATTKPSDHSSSLRSLRHILPEYLAHLQAGHLRFNGVIVKSAPQIKQLAKAIKLTTPTSVVSATAVAKSVSLPAAGTAPPTLIMPTTFEIPLRYAAPDAEAIYRDVASPAPVVPHLSYSIHPVVATSEKHQVRADRVNRVVFKPDHDVRSMVTVEALIDRIAFTVSTTRLTRYSALQSALARIDIIAHVFDRTLKAKDDWQTCLPKLDLSKATGHHFAVMVQEPSPDKLRSVLQIIEDIAGIDGAVRPCLLEMAVDFYPRNLTNPDDALMVREQIVGLLQRHHWSAGAGFLVHQPVHPRHVDPRQVYQAGAPQQTRYLFADTSQSIHADTQIKQAGVRDRLLSQKPGNQLYLNATIYRGELTGPRRTNIQHKISDRRDISKGTYELLANHRRRARVEVTLTSLKALEEAGLKNIEDLAHGRFRNIRRNYLCFRLPTCEANAGANTQAIAQMQTRGVHGVEMNQRAHAHEQREQMRPKPPNKDRDGLGLADWPEMSEMVGAALDRLAKKWRRF